MGFGDKELRRLVTGLSLGTVAGHSHKERRAFLVQLIRQAEAIILRAIKVFSFSAWSPHLIKSNLQLFMQSKLIAIVSFCCSAVLYVSVKLDIGVTTYLPHCMLYIGSAGG